MRHSWASWWYRLYRDAAGLRDEGGWATLQLVEVYQHRMPDGHDAAIAKFWGLAAVPELRQTSPYGVVPATQPPPGVGGRAVNC